MELTVEKKLALMHAFWLTAWEPGNVPGGAAPQSHAVWYNRVAKLLRITDKEVNEMLAELDHDWADRCFCSRPTNWKPQDSLNCIAIKV